MEQSIKKHAIKRTLRYWGYYVVRMFLVILLMGIIYGVIFARGETGGVRQTMISVMFYVAMMEGVMLLVLPMNYVAGNLPLVLSMGSGRKEAFYGIQFANLLFFLQTVLTLSIGGWMLYSSYELKDVISISMTEGIWTIFPAAIFLVVAIGQIGAWLSLRFGMKGSVIYTILFVLLLIGTVIGIGLFVGLNLKSWTETPDISGVLQVGMRVAKIAVFAVGLILYVIGFRLLKRTIMRYEVLR